jgi:hypothetical protein
VQYILVLQWRATSEADFDSLIDVEDALESDLDDNLGYVDGHDFGSGEMNIFIHTDFPRDAFQAAQSMLISNPRRADLRAAFRSSDGDQYTVLWPEELQEFSVS